MGAGKDGEIKRNPDAPRQEQGTPEGADMEGPSGCTSLGSCAGTQLSPQRCGEAGPELQDVSPDIFKTCKSREGKGAPVDCPRLTPGAQWLVKAGAGGRAEAGRAQGRQKGACRALC